MSTIGYEYWITAAALSWRSIDRTYFYRRADKELCSTNKVVVPVCAACMITFATGITPYICALTFCWPAYFTTIISHSWVVIIDRTPSTYMTQLFRRLPIVIHRVSRYSCAGCPPGRRFPTLSPSATLFFPSQNWAVSCCSLTMAAFSILCINFIPGGH